MQEKKQINNPEKVALQVTKEKADSGSLLSRREGRKTMLNDFIKYKREYPNDLYGI